MAHPCQKAFEYPSYECYDKIKYEFGKKWDEYRYSIFEDVLTFEKKHTTNIVEKYKELSDVFYNLKKYLSNGHVFSSNVYNGQGACKYISYLLCEGISKQYGKCDQEIFNTFKEFVDSYNKSTNHRKCKEMVKHLEDHEYKKIKELYHFYDKYKEILPKLQFWYKEYCEDVLYLVGLYNSFLYKYTSHSTEFNNILKKMGELMKPVTKAGGTKCRKTYPMNEPRLHEPPVEKTHQPPNTPLEPGNRLSQQGTLDSAPNSKSEKVRSSTTMLGAEQKIKDTENLQGSQVSDQLDAPAVSATSVLQEPTEGRSPHQEIGHSEQHESIKQQETYDLGEPTRSGSSYEQENPYGSGSSYEQENPHGSGSLYKPESSYAPGSYHKQGGYTKINEKLLPGEYPNVVTEQLEEHGPGKENVGFMTNVQNVISGIMKDVDPVPVVGVSDFINFKNIINDRHIFIVKIHFINYSNLYNLYPTKNIIIFMYIYNIYNV
ncbi:hypothetical protein PVNG_04347 [Plasmodium vivax North Korean]|uniref:Uncharacterized protein n=1 Tax=Plasmodium vivax North Korean TaxID=1035514 RepID=A0A0J9WC51_PLAVI|nr:hypothetical protein PVNG_04347 [Plasmodium vivax North Korean]